MGKGPKHGGCTYLFASSDGGESGMVSMID